MYPWGTDCVRKSIPRIQFAREDVSDRIDGHYPPHVEVSHPVTMYFPNIKNYPLDSTALFVTRRYKNASPLCLFVFEKLLAADA